MVAKAVHLVRHGEVHNPAGVIYGRLAEFGLSDRGRAMADAAAQHLEGRPLRRVVASPLLRTQQSAQPFAERFGLEVETDERLIEPRNAFEGRPSAALGRRPGDWRLLRNPLRPSWGEAYTEIVARMHAAVRDAFRSCDDEVVLVTHQLPIWMVHRSILGRGLPHDPRRRRCALSSVTTVEQRDGRIVETAYADPAVHLVGRGVDRGAT